MRRVVASFVRASAIVLAASVGSALLSASTLVPSEFVVKPGVVRYWRFNVSAGARVAGIFRASGGTRNDIEAIIAEWSECENWINGNRANVAYQSGRVTNGRVNVTVGPGQYCIAFSNRMSLLSAKEVAANVTLYSLVTPTGYRPERRQLSWLDEVQEGSTNWNEVGAGIPRPITPSQIEAQCNGLTRSAQTPEESAVARAGWALTGPPQTMGDLVVISAMSGSGGMCRGAGYQTFVFVDANFAGTLAPKPMEPRTDGIETRVRLLGADTLEADFDRYGTNDPLCCPSRVTTVQYKIENHPGASLTLAYASRTRPR
jgi:hypothetical protein